MTRGSGPRFRRRLRPRSDILAIKTVVAAIVATIGITTICSYCCFRTSSLLPSSGWYYTHALSVPITRLARTTTTTTTRFPLSTPAIGFNRRIATSAINNHDDHNHRRQCIYGTNGFALFMAPQTPQPRRPRRMLKKRTPKEGDGRRRKRNRRNRHNTEAEDLSSSFGTILPGIIPTNNGNTRDKINNKQSATQEYRPLVPSVRRDMGEDYWIDPEDLEREQRRISEQKKQRIDVGNKSGDNKAMSQEKLMTEVKAPYRQNWIGYFSLMVASLSIIVTKFPELLEPTPTIRFPDL